MGEFTFEEISNVVFLKAANFISQAQIVNKKGILWDIKMVTGIETGSSAKHPLFIELNSTESLKSGNKYSFFLRKSQPVAKLSQLMS